MVKIGMLLPEERMVEPARKIIEENHLDVVYLEAVHTVDAVNKARIAVEAGAHILVATAPAAAGAQGTVAAVAAKG